MYCNQCGKQIPEDASFCNFCGAKTCLDKQIQKNQDENIAGIEQRYNNLSKIYLPNKITFLLIAEAPPKEIRNFFYYIGKNQGNYCFFQNIMLASFNIKYRGDIEEKKHLLDMFCKKGYFLIDSVDEPIKTNAKVEIIKAIPSLFERIISFNKDNLISLETKIILIKNLVCEILKIPLQNNNDIVFNRTFSVKCVSYPRYFTDKRFIENLGNIFNK